MQQAATRRSVLKLLASVPIAAAASGPAFAAKEPLIGRLIREARAQSGGDAQVSQRIDFISRALLGVPYRANTLIGGPGRPEIFVVRDDVFDCVTFCETVTAAALARDRGEFEPVLRRIRYDGGEVRWDRRHHYFAEWCRHNVENRTFRRVAIDPSVTIDKAVDFSNYGKRQVSMVCVSRDALLANKRLLASGDVIAFVSQRSNLDFYHTGLVAFDKRSGALLLRHASQSRGRVIEERMDAFTAANGVKHVALLRAVDGAASSAERR